MGNRCRRLLNLVLSIIVSNAISPLRATLDFQNPHAAVVLKVTNAQLRVSNNQQVFGCSNRSITEDFGHEVASAWREAYSNGVIISQTGGTKVPQTDLVTANSNVVASLNLLSRTSSNALLCGLRVNSNAMLYGDRVNSNAVRGLPTLIRTYSNAFAFGIKNNSNAINALYYVPTADSIDGTQMVRYRTGHHVFHSGAYTVRGWVRFNDGFTVLPGGSVLMDTLVTVSGAIDLRDTGILALNNDLYLAHNVTLTSGGYIEGTAGMGGQANTIFMGGDLTLASDNYAKVLHITGAWQTNANSGNLVIDGCGHTLSIGSKAQIFVDQNVTLTLRNMTIKTSPASLMKPAIQLASLGSKLALDNVVFDLGADFQFDQGQIFIHDEVAVTGTSAFVYQSPKPSYITSGATWSFETGTTFSIAPSTYTDQPFTAGTATSNNFIVLADQSSALSLNNCSLKTTFTGARFTKGMVLFDNKVALDTQAGIKISGLGSGTGLFDANVTVSSVSFSPDGRYVAIGHVVTDSADVWASVYKFNGTSSLGTLIAYQNFNGGMIAAVTWSPDGNYLAIGTRVGLYICRFNGTSSMPFVATASFGTNFVNFVNSISWSPDGRYLAVGGNNGTTPLIVYRFDGVSLTQVVTTYPDYEVTGVAWNPDGKYLLVTSRYSSLSSHVGVMAFNGKTISFVTSQSGSTGSNSKGAWSPDGRYALWANDFAGAVSYLFLKIFNGSSLSTVGSQPGFRASAVAFSPDGNYVLAAGSSGYALYRVDTSGMTQITSGSFGTVATTVAWSPDSKYVLVGGTNGTTDLIVFPVTRTATAANTQGFTNGLVFGDKTKGDLYDADVRALGGASVAIRGMVLDDSA